MTVIALRVESSNNFDRSKISYYMKITFLKKKMNDFDWVLLNLFLKYFSSSGSHNLYLLMLYEICRLYGCTRKLNLNKCFSDGNNKKLILFVTIDPFLWSNGLVVKALDSQSRSPMFKTTGWFQGRLSLSSFRG